MPVDQPKTEPVASAGSLGEPLIQQFAKNWLRGLNKQLNAALLLRSITLLFLLGFIVLPLSQIFVEALSKGWLKFWQALMVEDTRYALNLSLLLSAASLSMATVFGIAAAWCMSHFQFRGKTLLISIIDLPISISPIVIGLMFIIIYGKFGYLGSWLEAFGIKIIFSWPGLMLTNMCITTPYVLRSILPSMQGLSSEQERVGRLLGANGWQILSRITLPRIKWALLYGMVMALARSMGEFGAASVVSGLVRKSTVTLPLQVEIYYNEYMTLAAFSCASLFVLLALLTLVLKLLANRRAGN